jgi:hypothetical protein
VLVAIVAAAAVVVFREVEALEGLASESVGSSERPCTDLGDVNEWEGSVRKRQKASESVRSSERPCSHLGDVHEREAVR